MIIPWCFKTQGKYKEEPLLCWIFLSPHYWNIFIGTILKYLIKNDRKLLYSMFSINLINVYLSHFTQQLVLVLNFIGQSSFRGNSQSNSTASLYISLIYFLTITPVGGNKWLHYESLTHSFNLFVQNTNSSRNTAYVNEALSFQKSSCYKIDCCSLWGVITVIAFSLWNVMVVFLK